jgi:HK97 family phage prohead protease
MTVEHRAALEFRAIGRRLEGIAAPFDQVAHVGGFDEVIRPGAFAESIADGHDILALVDHDQTRLLGRTRNGSLRLHEDRQGLLFEIDVPNTTLGSDVLEMARRGDLGGMSFGFRVRKAGERWSKTLRELRSLDLIEVSAIAAWPAYEGTEVHARSRQPGHLALARRWLETV